MALVPKVSNARRYALKAKYGITAEQYYELYSKTDGCNLCGKTEEEEGQSLAVDHNHKTGEVRGVLCGYCNHRVIGRHVDPLLLRRMAEYLERGQTGWFVPKKKRKRNVKSPRIGHRNKAG